MSIRKKKGFTLIELIAVLVIMAILALIVTPLVMNIIRKARTAADKRSIDAYGRSIEIAIAGYLLDTGTFPTSMNQLTVEYSGDRVVCSTTQIKSDSSVYLADCTVGGRNVDGYTYGKEETVTYDAYKVGDEITYNNVDYYVIEDSSASEANVTLLKKTPLTVAEVNQYGGVGTANNHVNMYVTSNTSSDTYQKASNQNGYGGMAYLSKENCFNYGYSYDYSGCSTNYNESDVKYVVDAWSAENVSTGLKDARLLSLEDITNNLAFEWGKACYSCNESWNKTEDTPSWVYDSNYNYWIMTSYDASTTIMWVMSHSGSLFHDGLNTNVGYSTNDVVRPVITIKKSVLEN